MCVFSMHSQCKLLILFINIYFIIFKSFIYEHCISIILTPTSLLFNCYSLFTGLGDSFPLISSRHYLIADIGFYSLLPQLYYVSWDIGVVKHCRFISWKWQHTVSYSLHFNNLWISAVAAGCCCKKKKSFFDEGWELHVIGGHKDTHLACNWGLYCFKEEELVGPPKFNGFTSHR